MKTNAQPENWEALLKRVLLLLADRTPGSPVSERLDGKELDRVAYYTLVCCLRDSRFQDITGTWATADAATRDDMQATVREVLLTTYFRYQGNTATIRYCVAASAHPLRRLARERGWTSLDITGAPEPRGVDSIASTDASLVIQALCKTDDIGIRKFVVLCLLTDTAGYTYQQILALLEAPPLDFPDEKWTRIRGSLPLPEWASVHAWFRTGPPVLRLAAIEQYVSRYRARFRRRPCA
ncbi:MAG: hypothetical protein V4671_15470 [Armatimonadota bacterium]